MDGLVVAVVLGLAVLAGGLVQRWTRIPAPWAWVVIGAGLSFVPSLHAVSLPPDVVLLLFLPALLYWEGINTSLQQLRYDARVITLLSVGLVAATAVVVSGLGALLGLAGPVALVLGAILSPTDATAVAAMAPRLPRRTAAILRGESLVNDGSALALYAVAVAAVVAGNGVQPLDISLRFLYAVVVGVASGLVVGFLIAQLRRLARRPAVDDTISILSPFLLFLPAEALGASGVVAVVTGVLLLGRLTPRIIPARSRNEGYSFWRASTSVINGALFVLIGLQARSVYETFAGDGWARVLLLAVVCAVAVFGIRVLWNAAIAPIIRLLDRRPSQRERRAPLRTRMVIAWGGFRGAVSLAAALSLPLTIGSGRPFPGREEVIAVTFVVIVLMLFVQGATMPLIVRRARLAPDTGEQEERRLALTAPLETALEHLDEDARAVRADDDARAYVQQTLEHQLEHACAPADGDEHSAGKHRLLLRTLRRRREEVIRLRSTARIDDTVMLDAQAALDYEELRISADDDPEAPPA
ncbi:Na+/H+ antiporter [Pseudolysinimonas sp.]|uniref:Na+/H+ antiporter n=1 Tax=Pseudolysinimonas sp. TaxID=2680009 RepID=UPI003F7F96D4